eukprot:CAMPEP_0201285416 /NCGR_PEP_ID=MMETSP1317-20130820/107345_1 /ASSEMBLY_ACC=CAM_ASM_000770 /TAXON_ID=187299 /ORGANISM="Undescribed Undescribed, Strain Undescribed" /LENGTH=54 /DNA_ID=CAMNT_0047610241 /DNA_START=844 /DNA_END=1008 /DNA_ORIENTATION=-
MTADTAYPNILSTLRRQPSSPEYSGINAKEPLRASGTQKAYSSSHSNCLGKSSA